MGFALLLLVLAVASEVVSHLWNPPVKTLLVKGPVSGTMYPVVVYAVIGQDTLTQGGDYNLPIPVSKGNDNYHLVAMAMSPSATGTSYVVSTKPIPVDKEMGGEIKMDPTEFQRPKDH